MHGHRVQLDRLRLLDVTLIGRVLVRLRRSRDGSNEWTLVLPLSLVNFHGVPPVSEVILIVVHLLLVLVDLLVPGAQLLDCVILLLLVHDLLRLLFGDLDLHVPEGILQISVRLLLLVNDRGDLLPQLIVTNDGTLA